MAENQDVICGGHVAHTRETVMSNFPLSKAWMIASVS